MICKYTEGTAKEVVAKLLHPIDYRQTLALDHTVVAFSLSEHSIGISYNMASLFQNSSNSNSTCIR